MSKQNNLPDFLIDLADGIRTAEGTTDPINPQDFRSRVEALANSGGGGESGVPIEVAELPTATADTVGKVYFNTTDGNYYVGKKITFEVGEPLGDKIYFDTTKDPLVHGIFVDGEVLLEIEKDTTSYQLVFVDVLAMQGVTDYGHCYGIAMSTPDMSTILGISYLYCDVLDVEQFNTMIGSQFGVTITQFGWQTDVIDTSVVAEYEVTENNLANWDFLAYGNNVRYELEKTNIDEINELTAANETLETQKSSLETQVSTLTNEKQKLNNTIEGLTLEYTHLPDDFRVRSNHREYAYAGCLFSTIPFEEGFAGPIKRGAFYRCIYLKDFSIAEGVTDIREYAFEQCYNINSIVFPSTLTSISLNTFAEVNKKATSLTFLSATPPTINAVSVLGFAKDDCVIYVPASSVDTYKADPVFGMRANYIQAIAE